jgi:hypothetical protein
MAVIDAALTMGPPFPEAARSCRMPMPPLPLWKTAATWVEAVENERAAVMALPVERITLHLTQPVLHYMQLMGAVSGKIERTVKQEAAREWPC